MRHGTGAHEEVWLAISKDAIGVGLSTGGRSRSVHTVSREQSNT